jgi:hypothetical protein
MLDVAKFLVRNHGLDKPAKKPLHTIYKIMQYCGMCVVGRENCNN